MLYVDPVIGLKKEETSRTDILVMKQILISTKQRIFSVFISLYRTVYRPIMETLKKKETNKKDIHANVKVNKKLD